MDIIDQIIAAFNAAPSVYVLAYAPAYDPVNERYTVATTDDVYVADVYSDDDLRLVFYPTMFPDRPSISVDISTGG